MLSIEHPSILQALRQFHYGLMPVFFEPGGTSAFVLKLSKEAILAAQVNNAVKIYLISDDRGAASHLGIITAFFDDQDEPRTIATALYEGDVLLPDVVSVLSQPTFFLYFFDELDREWMSVQVTNSDMDRCVREFASATFASFDSTKYTDLLNRLTEQFGARNNDDDRSAFTLTLGERLYPDDIAIFDFRPEVRQFRVAQPSPAVAQLVREHPGPPNERDIAVMFSRAFPAENIYLNPFRVDTNKELTDVLVVTEQVMLFVEAKDSPNTKASLNRSIQRKRQTTQKQIDKAAKQLQGGLGYAKDHGGVEIQTANGPITVPLNGRQLLGLIVVGEMFDSDQLAIAHLFLT